MERDIVAPIAGVVSERTFERWLTRDAKFTRTEARAVMRAGYHGLKAARASRRSTSSAVVVARLAETAARIRREAAWLAMTAAPNASDLKSAWLKIKSEIAYARMLMAGAKYGAALGAGTRTAKFNPYHDELGRFTFADGAGSGGGLGGSLTGGPSSVGLGGNGKEPAQTNQELVRVAQIRGNPRVPIVVGRRIYEVEPYGAAELAALAAEARAAREEASRVNPEFRPGTYMTSETPEGQRALYEGQIAEANAAIRGEGRFGIGGNGPPREPSPLRPSTGTPGSIPFDYYNQSYRDLTGMPELIGPVATSKADGTVALTEIGGQKVFGINSDAPGFTSGDREAANVMRDTLIEKYPDKMNTEHPGRFPNNAVYHAETTALLRAGKLNGGSLAGQTLEVNVDRPVCKDCNVVLPLVGLELGNPTVIFRDPKGVTTTIRDGQFIEDGR